MRRFRTPITLTLVAFGTLAALTFAAGEKEEMQAARVPAVVPDEAKNRENPIEADERSVDYGKLLFSSQCVMCHGKGGAGDGDLVERLKLVIPDLTDPAETNNRTDGELFYILSKGHGSMPGQDERFDEKTRWDIVNYVRTLPIDIR